HEHMACIALQAGEALQVAGVAELVEVDDRLVVPRQPVKQEVGADEASTTSEQNHRVSLGWIFWCAFLGHPDPALSSVCRADRGRRCRIQWPCEPASPALRR